MFTPYQRQRTPRAAGRGLTTNHSRAESGFVRTSPYRPVPVVGRTMSANHSRAMSVAACG